MKTPRPKVGRGGGGYMAKSQVNPVIFVLHNHHGIPERVLLLQVRYGKCLLRIK